MSQINQEYVGAAVILIVTVLKFFGVELGNDVVSGLVVGLVSLYLAIRQKVTGQTTLLGVRK